MLETKYKIDDYKLNFLCNEETRFYSYCVEEFVLSNTSIENIVEFGSGDGKGIIKAIKSLNYQGKITGFEINSQSIELANNLITKNGLKNIYKIENKDFFNQDFINYDTLISNPPYLPSYNKNLVMPGLYGGLNGNEISKQLIDLEIDKVMILLSSYCDPQDFIEYCQSKNYSVTKFMSIFMEFGFYSSEDKVMERINAMKECEKAFFTQDGYILAGILLEKKSTEKDISSNLIKSICI